MSGSQLGSMIACIALLLIAIASIGYSIYRCRCIVKDKRAAFDFKKELQLIAIFDLIFVLSISLTPTFIYGWAGYNTNPGEWFSATIGLLLCSCALGVGSSAFILHYYGKKFPVKLDKTLYWILMGAIPLALISFFLATNGFANMGGDKFIFPNGISFTEGWTYPIPGSPKANITFYAVCILAGAVLVYFICDHYMYKEYGKHGILETTFLIAFPAGILGARIAYVIGNWSRDGFGDRVASGEWWCIFAVWEGGLTILGGAIAGILVGMLVFKKTTKNLSLLRVIDLAVPTILIAQAIGRWGNFFNAEVHGELLDENAWLWLPRIVFNNAHYSSKSVLGYAPEGYIYAPFFFIEFITNLFGYFVLAHLFGKRLSFLTRKGDLGAGYLIWYGSTRVFMEPIRHTEFKMGEKDYWSWFWALSFVLIGALGLMINHLLAFKKDYEKGLKTRFNYKTTLISSFIFSGLSIAPIIIGTILMATGEFSPKLEYNNFNDGIIILAIGLSLLALSVPCYYETFKGKAHNESTL